MVKVLVTGGTGFIGRYVIRRLARIDLDYRCAARSEAIAIARGLPAGRFAGCDLRVADAVYSLVSSYRPSHVIHLAGNYGPGVAEADLHDDVLMMRNVFAAVERLEPAARVVTVSSASIYGTPLILPVTENHPCFPSSSYGRSKLEQELVTREASRARGIRACVARCFNVTGPGEPARLLIGRVALEVARLERGAGGEIRVGDMSGRRDFLDVRDAANALVALALAVRGDVDQPEIFNVCSGRSIRVGDLVDLLISRGQKPITLAYDGSLRSGASEVEDVFGSNGKLTEATGWRPQIPIEQSLNDTLDYFRNNL